MILITLRYDEPASFPADTTFGSCIARQIRWGDDDPVARVVLRHTIMPEGTVRIDKRWNRPTTVSNAGF